MQICDTDRLELRAPHALTPQGEKTIMSPDKSSTYQQMLHKMYNIGLLCEVCVCVLK